MTTKAQINNGIFSAARDDWETPQELFDRMDRQFHFEMDVAATAENTKCINFYTREMDGLSLPWSRVNWCNPPYGAEILEWCRKADEEAQNGNLTVMLIPARTDAGWFHEYCKKYRIEFIRGRIKFVGAKYNAPFPSMFVFFGKEFENDVYNTARKEEK